ncbi:MAG: radical SAM protein [Candidatus Omnitrophica bacterium]|nr:radical SAM protein [Candidatus Omnitrophota bacterium]
MKYFFIASIGCFSRHLDCERIKNYFIANKVALTTDPEKADYIFISTCGLTKLHEDLSIDDILRLKRFSGQIIVGGCLPEMNAQRLADVFNGKIIGTKDLDTIDELFPEFLVKFKNAPDGNMIRPAGREKKVNGLKRKFKEIDLYRFYKFLNIGREIYRKFLAQNPAIVPESSPTAMPQMPIIDLNNNFFSLRISSGCLGGCSYCNIKKAIGSLRSKPVSVILEELRKGLKNKQYRFNVISSDTGAYGLDIHSSLPQLLKVILEEDKRIVIEYLGNMNPVWMCRYKNELLGLFKTKRIKSTSTAIQSGSQRILKLMHRDANIDEFKGLMKELKKVYPALRVRTQIIVGFPTETEQDIQDTIDCIRECSFDEVDVFHYYETEIMDSVKIAPKISRDIITKRMQKVRKQLSVFTTVNYFN